MLGGLRLLGRSAGCVRGRWSGGEGVWAPFLSCSAVPPRGWAVGGEERSAAAVHGGEAADLQGAPQTPAAAALSGYVLLSLPVLLTQS